MGKLIGLDIGIASVGWAVVEDNDNIVELGSNLFDSADASNNAQRRTMRGTRRLIRRKKTRIKDFNKLWIKVGQKIYIENYINIVELKCKGLNEKLSENEIYCVLVNYLKHRGITYLDDMEDDGNTGGSDYQKSIEINKEELKNKFPCEIQKERLNNSGKYRGRIESIGKNDISLINVFNRSSYLNEIIAFLNKQSEFHNFIDEMFIDKYTKLFSRKREYYIGPGNEKSRTDYGVYTTKKGEDGKYLPPEDNIFEKLIGKCTVYNGLDGKDSEQRAPKASLTAQYFDFYNDLNNLTVNNKKLTKEEKEEIKNEILDENKKSIKYLDIIAKVCKEDKDTIFGYRKDTKGKCINDTFETYRKLRKFIKENSIDDVNDDKIDEISYVLTINTEHDEIVERLKDKNLVSEETAEKLYEFRKQNKGLFSKWHHFSIRLMKEILPTMIAEPKEQMTVLTEAGCFKSNIEKYKEYNNIPIKEILNNIYNPVVKRSVRIAIRVLNALLDKYSDIKKVVIEMPRDKNSKEEQDRIKKVQKQNESEIKDIQDKLSEYGINNVDLKHESGKTVLKLKLWKEQNGKCIYSGRDINPKDILNSKKETNFEIDHIIPLSISFDDSRNNKVLVYAIENQNKGQNTPYKYFGGNSTKYNEFKQRVLDTYKTSVKDNRYDKKISNLLFTEDITKIDVLKDFINRNINDTGYASKTVLNICQNYFKAKNIDIKVKTIKGAFTSEMRKNLGLNKDRDESNGHHAIDASLLCFSQLGYDRFMDMRNKIIDIETGEMLDKKAFEKGISSDEYNKLLYQSRWLRIKESIDEAKDKKIKYWYRVDKKPNRQISDQTIRGTRVYDGEEKVINSTKLSNIYKLKSSEIKKDIINNKENLLIYINDRKSYEQLVKIYERYKEETYPFAKYREETGDYIRKYAKNNKGPIITRLKYIDGKLGSHIDISHKYKNGKKERRVILEGLNPYRTDIYFNNKDKKYIAIGIKLSDIVNKDKHFVIDEKKYLELLIEYGLIKVGQDINELENNGYSFKFSLYKNDFIRYEKEGVEFIERFLSLNNKNLIEVKCIEKKKFDTSDGRKKVSVSTINNFNKINVDILCNQFIDNNSLFSLAIG